MKREYALQVFFPATETDSESIEVFPALDRDHALRMARTLYAGRRCYVVTRTVTVWSREGLSAPVRATRASGSPEQPGTDETRPGEEAAQAVAYSTMRFDSRRWDDSLRAAVAAAYPIIAAAVRVAAVAEAAQAIEALIEGPWRHVSRMTPEDAARRWAAEAVRGLGGEQRP